jgi:MFS family permease
MAVVFVPQLSENALRIPGGRGGYLVIVLGLASGIGAPLSGRLTDRFGAKAVLGFGMLMSAAAAATVVWWMIPHPSLTSGWFSGRLRPNCTAAELATHHEGRVGLGWGRSLAGVDRHHAGAAIMSASSPTAAGLQAR